MHPQPRVRFVVGVCTRVFTAEAPDTSGIPHAMVLRLISCSPRGPGFLAPVIPEKLASQELGASVGASGPHDFTVRDLGVRLTRGRVHRIPPPTFVTIAKRPSSRPRDARKSARDLPDGTSALACDMLARRAICAWLVCWRDGCATPTGSTPFALPRRRRQSSFRVRTSCVPERPLSLRHHRSRIVHARALQTAAPELLLLTQLRHCGAKQ